MSRPDSKNRIRRAAVVDLASHDGDKTVAMEAHIDGDVVVIDSVQELVVPAFWGRGALLNVRTTGGDYIVTLYPEEYDARSPERAMRFANPALCQNFVSQWYMRQSHDPRAW